MPLPTPNVEESQEDFMSRCMADGIMNVEFPDSEQRYAVCMAQYTDKVIADFRERLQ